MKPSRLITAALLLAGLTLAAGCEKPLPPRFIVGHYLSSFQDLEEVNRVAFINLSCENTYPSMGDDLTESLYQSLQERQLFTIKLFDPASSQCKDYNLSCGDTLTLQQLHDLREQLDCDAVLLGSVTNIQPYPRMRVCLRLRLIDLRKGQMVWSVDHTWDTTEKATESRIKEYFCATIRKDYEPLDWRIATISPKMFGKFVAHEVADTLPKMSVAATASRPPGEPINTTLIRSNKE